MKSIPNRIGSLLSSHTAATAIIQTLVVRIFILAINMGTGIITARFLGPEGRGEQAAMLLWPQFLAYTITLGLPKSLLYNLKKHPEEKSELFAAALLMGTGLGMVASLIGIIFMPQWLSQYSPSVIRYAQWFMVTAPLALLGVTFTAAFESEEEFTIANQTRYLVPLTTLAALGVLILIRAVTPFNVALAYVVPGLPIFIWMLTRLWNRFRPRWRRLGESFKCLTSYGLRSYGIDLLGALSGQIGSALVVGLLSATSMGLYTVALSLSRLLNMFEDAIVTVLLPKAVARPVEEVVALTGRAVRVSTFLTLLCIIPLMLLCPVILSLLYGSEFMGAVPVFRILLIEIMLNGMTWVLAQAFMASGQPGTVTLLQGVGLGLTVPLMLVLIPKYQLVGAGLSLLGSTLARFVFILVSFPLVLKISPPGLLITREDWRYLKQIIHSNT